MNESGQPDGLLGNQGASDFGNLIGGTAPSTQTQSPPNQQSNNPAVSSNGGGSRGVPLVEPPKPLVKPLAESTGVEPPQNGAVLAQDGTTPTGVTPGLVPAQTPAQNQQLSPDIVSAAIEAGIRASREQSRQTEQVPQGPAKLSDAEFAQKYNIPTVTPAHITAILDQDPIKASYALNAIIQQTLTAAVRMSADMAAAEAGRVREEFNPHITSWQSHQKTIREKEAETQFYTAYPELNDEKALVNEIKDAFIARIRSGQISFKTPQEAFQAVATSARNLLTRFGKLPAPGANGSSGAPQTQATGQQQPRQMSAALSAGRTGTGQPATPKGAVEEVFGADAR